MVKVKATIKALNLLSTTKRAWWVRQALYHYEAQFLDLLPQLQQLIYTNATLEDLSQINEINN